MKALKRILFIAIAIAAGLWIVVQFMGRNPPPGLGPTENGLAECPDTPNCVCSDCDATDKMPPLEFSIEPTAAKSALKKALGQMKIEIHAEQQNYIHAVAITPLMRFRDDLEFLIQPEEKKIQFRSASRLGRSDLGKNRERLTDLFALLEKEGIRAGKSDAAN